MSSPRVRLFVVLSVVFATLPFIVGAGNGDGGNSDAARAEHQRIIDFWTPERVAQAVPRDFVFDPGTGRFSPSRGKPNNPGGGGGGDGGGSTLVAGSSWKKGGEIDGAVGKVLFALGTSYYVCSATVIDDGSDLANGSAMILTAAHCVYDEGNGYFASNWMFIPDYDDKPVSLTTSGSFCSSTAYGCWTPEAMAVHNRYATAGGFNSQAVQYDFAVVRVGLGGPLVDSGLELDGLVIEQEYDFSSVLIDGSVGGYAFGYPAQKKWKGNDLIYCAGPIDGDPYNSGNTYRMNECKLNGGSSGGGWLSGFDEKTGSGTVMSLNSYGYTGINAMHGPFLNSDTQDVYTLAQGLGGIAP